MSSCRVMITDCYFFFSSLSSLQPINSVFFHDHFQFLLRTIVHSQWLVTMSIGGGSEDPCGRGRPCATNSLNGPSFILSPLFRSIQKINECTATGGPGSAKQKLRQILFSKTLFSFLQTYHCFELLIYKCSLCQRTRTHLMNPSF